MASGFPGSIDSFTNPTSTSALNSPSHSGQHTDLNDAVNKIETYMGLVKVIPTSVTSSGGTSATLASNGTITVGSNNTSVTVNGAFSALYDNYRVILSGGVGSTEISLQLKLGSATTDYYMVLNYAAWSVSATTVLTVNNGLSWAYAGCMDANQTYMNVDLFSPFLAKHTRMTGMYERASLGGPLWGTHNIATSYTAFTITCEGGNMSGGTIRVYGYRN